MAKNRQSWIGWKKLITRKKRLELGGYLVWSLFSSKKNCLTISEFGIIDEHKIFKGFSNVSDNLVGREYFKKADGGKLIAKVPLNWKKSFNQGDVIPQKIRNCTVCKIDILRDDCDKLLYQRKGFLATLKELKRQHPKDFGHMLPEYKTIL